MFSQSVFSCRLKALRKSRNITSQQLADVIGTSRVAISQFENEANAPSIHSLIALADYFDVSLDYLVGRSDDPARR